MSSTKDEKRDMEYIAASPSAPTGSLVPADGYGPSDVNPEWFGATRPMSTQRERRLFEALYALAKAVEALDGDGDPDVWENLRAALVEANEALAYPTTPDDHAPPGQDAL